MVSYEKLKENVVWGETDLVYEMVSTLIEGGADPMGIMTDGLISAMSVVGQKMKTGEMFIPEVLASAEAMNRSMALVKSKLPVERLSEASAGKFVIGTVSGDLHNIGKNIVAMLLSGVGFEVIDLGVDVPADTFAEAVEREQPALLGMSALLTTTMSSMKEVIELLESRNLRARVKVLIGGAPVTPEFAESIGADAYAQDAVAAIEAARQLMGVHN